MTVTYFKRYSMQYDLRGDEVCSPPLPAGYSLQPWNNRILKGHAEAKYLSFQNELDSNVFPCLGNLDGCVRLMKEISCRQGFLANATWLLCYEDPMTGIRENCGTIQGIRELVDVGSIQNLGIAPNHRGMGLGSILLKQSLAGFKKSGMQFVRLEVTAHNVGAHRLYQRMGFETVRTVYKSIELAY